MPRWLGLIIIIAFIILYKMYDSGVPDSKIIKAPQIQPRVLYQAALKAIEDKDWPRFNDLSRQLVSYPLYPELQYQAIRKQLTTTPLTKIDDFLSKYQGSLQEKKLRRLVLTELAQHQQWHSYVKYYRQAQANDTERCQYVLAKQQLGDVVPLNTYQASLWLKSASAPNLCNPIFDHWIQQGIVSKDQIWQRFKLALDANNTKLANYLAKRLPKKEAKTAKLWVKIHKKPVLVKKQLKSGMKTKKHHDMVTHGLIHWSKRQPNQVTRHWNKFDEKYEFTLPQKLEIIKSLSHTLIKRHPKKAKTWLAKIDYHYFDDKMMFWHIRYELAIKNWDKVKSIIEKIPAPYQDKPIWRYWYARALEHTDNKEQAKKIYQGLVQQRNYYGFLAAERLEENPKTHHKTLVITEQEKQWVVIHPLVQKAQEYYAAGDFINGNATWWMAIAIFNDKQRYVAAKLAKEWGWDLVSLKTSTKTRLRDDLSLRFPLLYRNDVEDKSDKFQLEPAMIFAIIRQESLFYPAAKSPAGARGLMQLMPYTAKNMIDKAGLPDDYKKQLNQPHINIHLGSFYIAHLFKEHYTHPVLTIASYNAGPHRIKKWLPKKTIPVDLWVELIPWHETRNYVKNVLTYIAIYQEMLGHDPNLDNYLKGINS